MQPGTEAAGTAAFAARHNRQPDRADFYRQAQEWTISSVGIGTYLGAPDKATTARYVQAVGAAIDAGINLIDTSLNYRHQQSELAIGEALAASSARRNELVLCTKAGYLIDGAVPAGLAETEIVAKMHSLHPMFLRDQLERSLANLRTDHVDVFYLHNPETQLREVSLPQFGMRLQAAFAACEAMADEGKLTYYGLATWDGFRAKPDELLHLDLEWIAELAREVAGPNNRLRFIQLPFNLAMPEACARYNQPRRRTLVDVAGDLQLTVIASAALMQGRLAKGLPVDLAANLAPIPNDAQRAIQFSRSAPGIAAALVGMSRPEHVATAAGLRQFAPLSPDRFEQIFFGAD